MTNNKLKEKTNNLKLIYEYSEKTLKDIDASRITILAKASLLISLNTFLLCLAPPPLQMATKVLFYGILFLSFFFASCSLFPKKGGEIILPEELMEKCLDISEEHYKKSIISSWNKSIKELIEARDESAAFLNSALFFFLLEILVFVLVQIF